MAEVRDTAEFTVGRWFAAMDADVALVRPDHYVFGVAKAGQLGDLVDELEQQVPVRLG